jgi:SAM-dependent methyltransferase
VPPGQRLSPAEEKAEYDKHENNPQDLGYRAFLSRLFTPLVQRLPKDASGLDFGCGPGPTLSLLFQKAGHDCAKYDPNYFPDAHLLEEEWDFITATEVVEHLFKPGKELERLWAILKPGGILGIMTKLVKNREAFSKWHYKNDPTHVCFFSRETFQWLARHLEAEMEFIGADVILLMKEIERQ